MHVWLVRTVTTWHSDNRDDTLRQDNRFRVFEAGADAVEYVREAIKADHEYIAQLSELERTDIVLHPVPEHIDLWNGHAFVMSFDDKDRLVSYQLDLLPFSRKTEV